MILFEKARLAKSKNLLEMPWKKLTRFFYRGTLSKMSLQWKSRYPQNKTQNNNNNNNNQQLMLSSAILKPIYFSVCIHITDVVFVCEAQWSFLELRYIRADINHKKIVNIYSVFKETEKHFTMFLKQINLAFISLPIFNNKEIKFQWIQDRQQGQRITAVKSSKHS